MAEFKVACRGCHGGCMYILTVEDGKAVKEIAEDSIVSFRYQLIIDGVLDDEEYIGIVDLSKPEDEFETKLKDMIIGKKINIEQKWNGR